MFYYRKEIDGLRALAVLPVIFYHAKFEFFKGGFVGVDVFFVISGYLITSLILKEQKEGRFTLLNFYERRFRRLLPALFFLIFCSIPFAYLFMPPGELLDFGQSVAATALFSSNFLFWQEAGYFAEASFNKPLLHTWSLAVEEQYYLLFPLFMIYFRKWGTIWILSILAIAGIISILAAEWGSIYRPIPAFYLLPTRGWEILIGVFAAFYLTNKKQNYEIFNKGMTEILGFFGLALIFYAVFNFDERTPFPGSYALIPTLGTLLVILFTTPQTLLGKLLSFKPILGTGLISYSLYLWHFPIFAFSRMRTTDQELTTFSYFILIGISFVMAFLSWRYVERFFRDRSKLQRKSVFFIASICILLALFFALVNAKTEGFKERFLYPTPQLIKTKGEFGKYVDYRFINSSHIKFNQNDNRTKLLIVGDSFAKDITNTVFESSLRHQFQVSTYFGGDCLFKKLCYANTNKKIFFDLVKDSEQIWLASDWNTVEVDFLHEFIKDIKKQTKAEVYIFGTKNFGRIEFTKYLNLSLEERLLIRNVQVKRYIEVNSYMKHELKDLNFIDLDTIYCQDHLCTIFDSKGDLLSFDSTHLTKEGAKFFGDKLSELFLSKTN